MTDTGFQRYLTALDTHFRLGDARVQEKQDEASNIELIKSVVAAIGRNDLAAVGQLLADDAQLDIKGYEELPFIRSASGRNAVLDAIRENFGALQDQEPTIEAVVAQGDTVVIVSAEEGMVRATGARYRIEGIQRFVCRDGKIRLVHEIMVQA